MTTYPEAWLLDNHLYRRSVEVECLETILPVGHEVDLDLPTALDTNGKVRDDDADVVVFWRNPLLRDQYEVIEKNATTRGNNVPYRITIQAPSHIENFAVQDAIEVEESESFDKPHRLIGMFLYVIGLLDNDRLVLIRGLVVDEDEEGVLTLKELEIIDDPNIEGFVRPIRGRWDSISIADDSTIENLLTNGTTAVENEVPVELSDWVGSDALSASIDIPYSEIPATWYRFEPQTAFLMPGVDTFWVYYGDPDVVDVLDSPIQISDRFLNQSGVLEFTRPGRDWQDSISSVRGARAYWRGDAETVTAVLKVGPSFGVAKIQLNDEDEIEFDGFALENGTSSVIVGSDLEVDVKHRLSITVTGETNAPTEGRNVGVEDVKIKIPSTSVDNGEEIDLPSWGGG